MNQTMCGGIKYIVNLDPDVMFKYNPTIKRADLSYLVSSCDEFNLALLHPFETAKESLKHEASIFSIIFNMIINPLYTRASGESILSAIATYGDQKTKAMISSVLSEIEKTFMITDNDYDTCDDLFRITVACYPNATTYTENTSQCVVRRFMSMIKNNTASKSMMDYIASNVKVMYDSIAASSQSTVTKSMINFVGSRHVYDDLMICIKHDEVNLDARRDTVRLDYWSLVVSKVNQ
jgi:hypothetical protein